MNRTLPFPAVLLAIILLFGWIYTAPATEAGDVYIQLDAGSMCDLDGYWHKSQDHPVEWSGRLIGMMLSGREIGLETVAEPSNYPVFHVALGEALDIGEIIADTNNEQVLRVKGYWQGIDCELYRAIYGRYGMDICVPLIEAVEVSAAD